MGLGHPLLEHDLLEVADLLHAAGREQVVEDRLVAGEALEAHDLLDEQRRVAVRGVRVAVLDVALGRDAAQAVVAHQSLLSVGLQHAAHEQQCAGRRVLDGPREGPVEDEVEGVRAASRRRASVTRSWRRRACRPRRRRRGRAAGCGRAPCRPGRRSARSRSRPGSNAGPRPSSISGSASSSELVGGEARQLDGALAARATRRSCHSPSIATKRRSCSRVRQPDRVRRRARSAPSTRIIVHLAGALERRRARVLERLLPLRVEVLGVGDRERSRRR